MVGVSEIYNHYSLDQVWNLLQNRDSTLVDLRQPSEFAQCHLPGSLSLPFSDKSLADRLASLVPSETSIIVLGGSLEQLQSAVSQFQDGLFPVAGVVVADTSSWGHHILPTQILPEITVDQIIGNETMDNTIVLDVREPIEWEMGHIPGALLISLGTLPQHLETLPCNRRIAVICEAGIRSSTGASILKAAGFVNVVSVPEGTSKYRNSGYPLQFHGTGHSSKGNRH